MVKFLVCALFYGDHPELARRCALGLRALRATGRIDLRLGLNEVSPRTRAELDALLPGADGIEATPQIFKFPMMRRLVHEYTGDATHLMWFDDDSCLLPGTEPRAWLDAVAGRAAQLTGSLGATYTMALTPRQREWIGAQPWFTGRELPPSIAFTTGGWFVVPLELLRRFDWPGPELRHFGGDVVLGALLQQQGLAVEAFRAGVAINADAVLRESEAARRGEGDPPGSIWQ